MRRFAIGERAQLNSGSPALTVVDYDESVLHSVICAWKDDTEAECERSFHELMLKHTQTRKQCK